MGKEIEWNNTPLESIELSDKERKELDNAWNEIMNDAKKVVEDYAKNPSEISGSTIRIHEDSPFVDESLKGNQWKKVVRGSVLSDLAKEKENKK